MPDVEMLGNRVYNETGAWRYFGRFVRIGGVVMAKNSHHVVPAPNGGWNVKKGGAERASKHFEKKEDAVK